MKRPLLRPKLGQGDIDKATESLRVFHEDLQKDIDDATDAGRAAKALRGDAMVLLDIVAPIAGTEIPMLTDREAAVLRTQLASAATAVAVNDFATAAELLTALADEAKGARDRFGPLRAEWKNKSAGLQAAIDATIVLRDGATSPTVRQGAAELAEQLTEIGTLGVGKGLTLPDAIGRMDNAAPELAALKVEEAAFLAFRVAAKDPGAKGGDGLEAAKARIDERLAGIEKLIHELHAKVRVATDNSHSKIADGRFVARLDQAKLDWAATAATAPDAASLDERGMMAVLNLIWFDIQHLLDDPDRLGGAIESGRLDRAREVYDVARAAAMGKAEQLLAVDAVAGAGAIAWIERLDGSAGKAATPGAYRKAAGELGKEAATIGEECAGQRAEVTAAQQALEALLAPLPEKLAALKALADKAKNGKAQTQLMALLATLQTSLNGLRAMRKLDQIEALWSTIDEATAFAGEVDASIGAASGKPDAATGATMSFDQARKAITGYKASLEKKDIKIFAAVTAFDISERVKALEKGLGGTTMSAMATEVAEIGVSLVELKVAAAAAKAVFDAFVEDLKPIAAKLEAAVFARAPAYKKSVLARLAAITGDARFEGGMKDAKSKALALSAELDAVVSGPEDAGGLPQALTDKQAEAVAANNQNEIEKNKWLGQSETLGKALDQLKPVNPGEVKPLIDSLASAKAAVKKNEDYAAGRDQLTSIRKRMGLIAANPAGLSITARNKLPKVTLRVKRAIENFGRGTAAVDSAVQALVEADLDQAGKAAVSRQLAAVRGLFNPAAFDVAVSKVAEQGNADTVRSAEREKALRALRQMQAYLTQDFRLQTLADTPFASGMDSLVSELALSLLDLENNLLVSM